jgi:hypothetical protein
MSCGAMGSPLPTILWYKDDRLLSNPVSGNPLSEDDDLQMHPHRPELHVEQVNRTLGVSVSELHIQCLSFQDVSLR